jgi:hypothetical protein
VRDRRPGGEHPGLGNARRPRLAVKEGVDLDKLKLDRSEGGLHLWLPDSEGLVQRRHRRLQRHHALITLLCDKLKLGEVHLYGRLLRREPNLHLFTYGQHLLHKILEQKFGVGLHGAELLLAMGELLMILQSGERTRMMNLIPIVNTLHRP